MRARGISVKVPATTANLGPGFDCLGMALDIFNQVTIEEGDSFDLSISGEGASFLPCSEKNAVYKAISLLYRQLGEPVPPLSVSCHNDIPIGRGLGSSAAAAVGGLVAANALCGSPFSTEELMKLGTSIEGHPDNVAPALMGGCTVVVTEGQDIICSSVPLPELKMVLFIPDFVMPTEKARRLLPKEISRTDAVYNIGRASLLVAALATGRAELLHVATQDRLHQPARMQIFPAMGAIFEAALRAGALGVFLSGAGSTILALSSDGGAGIGEAMVEAGRRHGIVGNVRLANPCFEGAKAIIED